MRRAHAWSRRLRGKRDWLLEALRAALDWQDPRLPPLGMA
jgi:hypothetical protein